MLIMHLNGNPKSWNTKSWWGVQNHKGVSKIIRGGVKSHKGVSKIIRVVFQITRGCPKMIREFSILVGMFISASIFYFYLRFYQKRNFKWPYVEWVWHGTRCLNKYALDSHGFFFWKTDFFIFFTKVTGAFEYFSR